MNEVCKNASGHPRIVCLANALKKTLGSELPSKLQLAHSVVGTPSDSDTWRFR